MTSESVTPFESIENAQEYLKLLDEVVREAREDVQEDVGRVTSAGSARRLDALRLIGYNLEKLAHHVKCSRRILNDLRTLRRVLHQGRAERSSADRGHDSSGSTNGIDEHNPISTALEPDLSGGF